MIERRHPKPKASYGIGFYRMAARLGPQRMEELRQETLKDQLAERAFVLGHGPNPKTLRDRTTYKDYPPPKGASNKSKRRKK